MSRRRDFLTCLAVLAFTFTSPGGDVRVDPDDVLVPSFRGWGTSLCWWANVIGGLENHAEFADALFTDLRLNIVRYNIGGGENPAYPQLPSDPRARMEGFRPARDEWEPDADANQRLILREAVKRGVNHIDAFSNSPPWWLTASGSVTGGLNPFANNLKAGSEKEFADYLIEVMMHLAKTDNIEFDTLSPMNEPLGPWWFGNRQEGCHMSPEQQARVLAHLHPALEMAGWKIGLVAPETFSATNAVRTLEKFPAEIRDALRAIASHGYDMRDRPALQKAAGETPVWMSEYGDGDASGLKMARAIIDDLNLLHVEEWVYWQAVEPDNGWGFLANSLDGKSTKLTRNPRYDVMRQFTNFITPGSRIVSTHDSDSVAALSADRETLVVVALNAGDSEKPFALDAAKSATAGSAVRIVRTSADEHFVELPALKANDGKLKTALPPKSVTTFILSARH